MVGIILVIGCILCYTGSSFLNKLYALAYRGEGSCATPVYAMISGLGTATTTLIASGFCFLPSGVTWIFGLVNGIVLFLFNLSVINAARTGPYSFQSLTLAAGNILLPLFFTAAWFHERFNAVQLIGIAIMLVSIYLFNAEGMTLSGVKKGYFIWTSLLFASNGLYGILMDAQQRAMMQTQKNEMIIITVLTNVVISIIYLLVIRKGSISSAFRMGKKAWLCSVGASIIYSGATNLMMIGLGLMPSAILYTALNGGNLIGSVSLSAIVFHEKLDGLKLTAIAFAVAALVILGL